LPERVVEGTIDSERLLVRSRRFIVAAELFFEFTYER
jgi:hypothetical protein